MEHDTIPVPVRRAVYWINAVLGFILFVVISAVGSGLLDGDAVAKWVAFITALTTAPGGMLGLAYSNKKRRN